MAENGAHFSGEGHLIEGQIEDDPNKTIRPIVCDEDGHLIIDLDASTITIGTVDQGAAGTDPWSIKIDQTGTNNDVDATITNFPTNQDVTVTNGAGAAAVNIQDGGNSITVDGTVTTIPSGTQDVNIVSTITLPVSFPTPVPVSQEFPAQDILTNATLTTSGSIALNDVFQLSHEITVVVSVVGPVTGTLPTLQFTLWNVDQNGSVFDPAMSGVITTPIIPGTFLFTVRSPHLQLNWDITGTLPSFSGVNVSAIGTQSFDVQVVSGTVTALQGTSPWVVSGTVTTSPNVNIHDSAGNNLNSTGTSLNVNVTNTVPVTGPLTDTQLRASPVPISGTVTANLGTVDGLALDATLTNGTQKAQVVDGSGNVWGPRTGVGGVNYFPVINLEAASNGSAVALRTLQIGGSDGTNLRNISTDTTGKLNINNISGTISLPTGASTAALQTQPGVDIGDVTVNNAAGASAVNIQDGGNSITVDGSVAVTQSTSPWVVSGTVAATQSGTWNINNVSGTVSLPTGAATEATLATRLAGQATTSAVTRVASSTASQQLIASNASRKMLMFYNDSTGQQFIKFGTTASQTDFTVRMTTQSYYELPVPCYTGRVDVICTNSNGAIQVTELT